MNLFKKIFNTPKQKEPENSENEVQHLSLDQEFVQNFIQKNGKFLYCTTLEEVTLHLSNIVKENSWEKVICNDTDLLKLIKAVNVTTIENLSNNYSFFTSCEQLIAENGSILFSSNQLKDYKIAQLSENFIVYATTSQLVKSKGDSLTGIKVRYQGNIPSNISAINSYNIHSKGEDFMSYGSSNAKNLYLLLFEDL
jgi:hypothetical protein